MGAHDRAWRLLRRYIGSAAGIVLVVVPLAWIWMESLIRIIYGARYVGATDAARLMLLAAAVQLILGWTKSFPVSIGRPGCAPTGQALEIGTLVPLVLVLGSLYGAAGAAGGVFGSSLVLAAFWLVGLLRMRGAPARRRGRRRLVRVLIVSGIWPPDVGGPASHAPELAAGCARAATRSRW